MNEKNGLIEYIDGSEHWFLYNRRHRIGGPAVTHADGTLEWWVTGQLHRDDGPAYIPKNGDNKEWWLHGEEYSLNDYLEKLGMTKEEQVLFKLKWGE